MKIVFAASEGVPYCKTGGLADVIGALSKVLAKSGHEVAVFLPLYKDINREEFGLRPTSFQTDIQIGDQKQTVRLWDTKNQANLFAYFIEAGPYFDREGIYGYDGGGYADNHLRYAFFSKAVLEFTKQMGFKPDVIHSHDWHTGLIPAYLKSKHYANDYFAETASVFSIHNMAYQGIFQAEQFDELDFSQDFFTERGMQHNGQVNFLKAGLQFSDAINTVSPTYAHEIQNDPNVGMGLESVVQGLKDRFSGILNGLDTQVWNPETDKNIQPNYRVGQIEKRQECKSDLQKVAGFDVKDDVPLFGFIGRMVYQKGIDLLIDTIPGLVEKGCQVVILGRGEQEYEKELTQLAQKNPKQVFLETDFAEPLAHKIYAGSDFFLMPSRFEPCGLGQLIAMRYGAVPIVTPTGGLVDTVKQDSGFVSESMSLNSYEKSVQDGLALLKNKSEYQSLQKRIMLRDFSWDHAIKDYMAMYEKAIRTKKEQHVA